MAVAAITVVYTFLGGMKAVIWTDVIQFSVYIVGALVALMILAGKLPGGWPELFQTARRAGKFRLLDFSLDLTRPYHVLGRPDRRHGAEHGDPRGRPDDGPALSLGPIAAAGRHGPGGQRFRHPGPVRLVPLHRRQPVGVLRGVPPFAGVDRAASGSDEVFTYFIVHYLPTGVLGLVIAAIFSAAMGTLAGR